jgi:hypothetical protein
MSSRKTYSKTEFLALQKHWYERLAQSGFEDAEDTSWEGSEKLLRRWSGISIDVRSDDDLLKLIDIQIVQEPETPVKSSFPVSLFSREETLLNHPEFKLICESMCRHGNSSFTTDMIILIWRDYCGGFSTRDLEKKYKVSDTAIFRLIRKATEWMNVMGDEDFMEEISPETTKVIVRRMDPIKDAPLIYSSWRNSIWYDEERDERLGSQFFSLMTSRIKNHLRHQQTEVRIACLSDDLDFIIGYSVFSGTKLLWVYIKIRYRNKGIGKLLTQGLRTVATPMTKTGRNIVSKKKLIIEENADGREEKKEQS